MYFFQLHDPDDLLKSSKIKNLLKSKTEILFIMFYLYYLRVQ